MRHANDYCERCIHVNKRWISAVLLLYDSSDDDFISDLLCVSTDASSCLSDCAIMTAYVWQGCHYM
jgi:hypothetical protein